MKYNPPDLKVKVAVLLSGVLALSTVQAATVSFTDAWHQVLLNNDALNAKKAGVARAEHFQDARKDLYLPDISLSASYTHLDKPVSMDAKDLEPFASLDPATLPPKLAPLFGALMHNTVTEITDQSVATSSIRAIWPIFTGGRITAAQDIAKSQTEEARFILAMEEQARFEDLSKIYFGVVLAEQVLVTRTKAERGLKTHFDHAISLEEQGQIPRVERLQAEASYDKAKVETRKAKRQLEIISAALRSALQSNEVSQLSSSLFTNAQLPPLDNFVQRTLTDYPGLGILATKEKQANGLIAVEKGSYYPEVFLYGNYSLHEADTIAAKLTPDWAVGIGVNFSLIDSAGHSGKVQAAYSAVDQVKYLQAQARRDLTVLVEKTYREANQALEEFQGLNSSVKLAEENVRLRQKGFSQGLSTSLEVVDAQLFLASVKTQQLAASYQYVISLSRLLAVSGSMNSFSKYQDDQGIEVRL